MLELSILKLLSKFFSLILNFLISFLHVLSKLGGFGLIGFWVFPAIYYEINSATLAWWLFFNQFYVCQQSYFQKKLIFNFSPAHFSSLFFVRIKRFFMNYSIYFLLAIYFQAIWQFFLVIKAILLLFYYSPTYLDLFLVKFGTYIKVYIF